MQLTVVFNTAYGASSSYEIIVTVTFIEENGELKALRCKDFVDPQKHENFIAAVERASVSQTHKVYVRKISWTFGST